MLDWGLTLAGISGKLSRGEVSRVSRIGKARGDAIGDEGTESDTAGGGGEIWERAIVSCWGASVTGSAQGLFQSFLRIEKMPRVLHESMICCNAPVNDL